jgi:hypothetical protein
MFSERSLSWMILSSLRKEHRGARIARKGRPEELCVGFFVSMTAPHHATKKYRANIHFISF